MRTPIDPVVIPKEPIVLSESPPPISDIPLKTESLPIKEISSADVPKLSTIPEKRSPGRPALRDSNGNLINKPKVTQGRTQIGPVSNAPVINQAPADHRFTITKIFSVSEKMMQRLFKELPEDSQKCLSPEKELEKLADDVNKGVVIIFPNSGGANKIIAGLGIIISISFYIADKVLLFKELRAKLNAKLSGSNSPKTPDKQ